MQPIDASAKQESKRIQQAAANLERLIRVERRNRLLSFAVPPTG